MTKMLILRLSNGHIPGLKEALAMLLERWGDACLVDMREAQKAMPEQMRIGST